MLDTTVETIKLEKGYVAEIHYDDSPFDPRKDFDNAGTMVCWHQRADLGDQTVDTMNYESYGELVEEFAQGGVVIPLWLYEHSGMTIQAGEAEGVVNPFSGKLPQGHAEFDSGQVGFAFMTPDKIVEEYGEDTPENREKAAKLLKAETEEYDSHLRGDVYGYVVKAPDGEVVESLWGMIGMEYAVEMAKDEGAAAARDHLEGEWAKAVWG